MPDVNSRSTLRTRTWARACVGGSFLCALCSGVVGRMVQWRDVRSWSIVNNREWMCQQLRPQFNCCQLNWAGLSLGVLVLFLSDSFTLLLYTGGVSDISLLVCMFLGKSSVYLTKSLSILLQVENSHFMRSVTSLASSSAGLMNSFLILTRSPTSSSLPVFPSVPLSLNHTWALVSAPSSLTFLCLFCHVMLLRKFQTLFSL